MSESGIFKAAVKLPPDRRAAYLDQACGSNAELRHEIESLLQPTTPRAAFFRISPGCPEITATLRDARGAPRHSDRPL